METGVEKVAFVHSFAPARHTWSKGTTSPKSSGPSPLGSSR